MKIRFQLIKIVLVASLLCGCSSTSAFSNEELILTQPISQPMMLFSQTVTEVQDVGEMPKMVYAKYKEGSKGIKWIASFVEGKLATVSEDFVITKDQNGKVISKTPVIGSRFETEAIPPKMQFGGSVSVGSEFFPNKFVTYGVDCVGCNVTADGRGGTSAGISVSKTAVKQRNGEWKEGIKYGNYYIVAADPKIPLCSILTIYDHGFSGKGLTPGKPFQAIVLDRGGSVIGNTLDLFKGSEKSRGLKNNRYANPRVVIERVGGKVGKGACKL